MLVVASRGGSKGRRKPGRRLRERIFERDGWRCCFVLPDGTRCKVRDKDELTLEHIVPLCVGGDNRHSNLETLCRRHNAERGAAFQAALRELAREARGGARLTFPALGSGQKEALMEQLGMR